MATGNFLVDIGLQEQVTTEAPAGTFANQAPYLQDIENTLQPTLNVPEIAEQEIDLASFGLHNMEEYQMMVDIKEQGGSEEDFNEILTQVRGDKVTQITEAEEVEVTEEDIQGFDIGVKGGQAISETAKKFKFQSNVDDGIIESTFKFLGNLPQNTAQIAGDLISIISDPVGTIKSVNNLAKAGVESTLNRLFLDDGKEHFTSDEIKLVSDTVGKEFNRLSNEPGRLKEILVENPADVLLSFVGGAGIAKNIAKSKKLTGLVTKLEKVESALNPIKVQVEALKLAKTKAGKIKKGLFPEKTLDELVLEISQGDVANLPGVKKTLGLIDTKGINTFEDFTSTISNKITDISRKQDTLLPTDEVLKIDDLVTTKGKRTTNFVKNALDDLEEVGNKSNDLELLNKVDDLRDKTALSVKDINDLARFYGSEFKNKSFDKLGNQKSSITSSTFENNRKGLKQISRDLLPDDTVKALDSELSALFETKDLASKSTKKVNDLFKKLNKRGIGAKIGGVVGKIINSLTLGAAGGLTQAFIGSNVGQKTMNSLAIQSNLAKNLKKFAELEKKADTLTDKQLEKETRSIFSDFVGDNALKIEAISNLENN